MLREPLPYRLYRDLRCPLRREVKHARGDAAKRHAAQAVFRAQIQRVGIAVGELALLRRGQAAGDDGADDMDDLGNVMFNVILGTDNPYYSFRNYDHLRYRNLHHSCWFI